MKQREFLISLLIPSFSLSLRVLAPSGLNFPRLSPQTSVTNSAWSKKPDKMIGVRTLSLSLKGGGPNHLVSAEWLRDNISGSSIKVLDSSWYLPTEPFDAHKEFSTKRIPGALFFDIDKICDTTSTLPHMMPSAKFFAECVGALGISRDSHVIVYDGKGQFSSARAWYMFKAFGHKDVSILDGGLPAWQRLGCGVDTQLLDASSKAPVVAKYDCELLPNTVLSMKDVEENIKSKERQLIDARPRPRFVGEAPEPRPIESGHIEGTFNVPWTDVINQDGTFKSKEEILKVLKDNGVDTSRPLGVSCGSGVSACVVAAALKCLGINETPVFDGAYTEWKSSGKDTFKGTEKMNYLTQQQKSKL